MNGLAAGAHLVDSEEFFDNVCPIFLIDQALRNDFPLAILVLVLQQHLAPIVLQVGGCCADPIVINCSIIAGCMFSKTFVITFLARSVTGFNNSLPVAPLRMYVGDASQLCTGEPHKVHRCV